MTQEMTRPVRVAIAHDYLTQRGGAEKVVLAMTRAFPDSPVYTTLFEPSTTFPDFAGVDVRTSRLNRIGFLRKNHRLALPLLPFASSSIAIDADVVLTSTSGWSHGFRTSGRKLVYCYSPARWLYESEMYLGESSSTLKRVALKALSWPLRQWDRRAAESADRYLAISTVVQKRITDAYGIASTLLPAPFTVENAPPEPIADAEAWLAGDPFHLCISRLLPYKNVDKIMAAFAGSDRKLVVVGRGPEADRLRKVKSDNVLMLSDLSAGEMTWLYTRCNAVVAASYEDYGLTPIEAGYHGKPSAVLRWGGFLDTVEEGVTGVYFDQPTPEAIREAVEKLERTTWEPLKIQAHVEQFSEERFAAELIAAVTEIHEETIERKLSR
ncbi:glycosyltransferase [Rhodococcoides kyotonense]|uniref:Glycosyltransferase involved in cell wall bisynthesis n=1 Tax=Rhodococcoides kyotonense TaxID=398843 RepID=A0A239J680_9NOCA|nr:glycosyltransferase [Rhodococcus kyotonensis]SNT01367.1 Glycosyltransferase involved in cell wall bisynthesis [Rhodococcus kyotonensis]